MALGLVAALVTSLLAFIPAPAAAGACSGYYALTFDDGPHPTRTLEVVRALDALDAPGTFFVVGNRVTVWPDVVRATAAAGHRIGNHNWAHETATRLSSSELVASIRKTEQAIASTGVDPLLVWRPPYGATSSRVRSVVGSIGYAHLLWTVDPQDWKGNSASFIASDIIRNTKPGGVIVLHDANANYRNTIAGLKTAVPELRRRGLCPGMLDDSGRVVAPGPVNQLPDGRLESVGELVDGVDVRGWTYDPDAPSEALVVHAYVDGTFAGGARADRVRPDVDRALGVGPNHGYRFTVDAAPGDEVCVYAINRPDGRNPQLGCQVVTGSSSVSVSTNTVPRGWLDRLDRDPAGVRVVGWALDTDVVPLPIGIHVYVDGRFAGGGRTGLARPDVVRALGIAGDHGFGVPVRADAGAMVCVYAINAPEGGNPKLGCATAP